MEGDELQQHLEQQNAALAEQNRQVLPESRPLTERERLHALVRRLWQYLPVFAEGQPDHAECVELAAEAAKLGITPLVVPVLGVLPEGEPGRVELVELAELVR